ncbi:MAG: serine/threonine protein kinase [Verrucomicrobiae bacterium]|nr:serine/threonine protein kinase [Verrucomicrobiae bacterium]
MGSVYDALQLGASGFQKRVALKLIKPDYAEQTTFLRNFIGEAKLVADLIHPNITQIYQFGECPGGYFMAMEMVDGLDLQQFMEIHDARTKKVPVELTVLIASRVARGLAYAHRKLNKDGLPLGLVHRDISPRNVLLSFEGEVKITDFGIAKAKDLMVDGEGEWLGGKAPYMAPEQARGEATDHRSDIYSLGVVLSEMLVGINIFASERTEVTFQKIQEMALPDFSAMQQHITADLNTILHRMMARSKNDRYPNAETLLYDLEHYIYHGGYGPTAETLAKYLKELAPQHIAPRKSDGGTQVIVTMHEE